MPFNIFVFRIPSFILYLCFFGQAICKGSRWSLIYAILESCSINSRRIRSLPKRLSRMYGYFNGEFKYFYTRINSKSDCHVSFLFTRSACVSIPSTLHDYELSALYSAIMTKRYFIENLHM